MDDTSPEIKKKMIELIQQKTPEERALMGASMFESSRYLMIMGLIDQFPDITEKELRREIFLRTYGEDFSPSEIKKILKYLDQHSNSSFLAWRGRGSLSS